MIAARVHIRAGTAATHGEPLTFGVPFAPGRVTDPSRLTVVGGTVWPTDVSAVERWPDGSIRWALVDTLGDVPEPGLDVEVRDDIPRRDDIDRLEIVTTPGTATIRSRRCAVAFDLAHPGLITRWLVDDHAGAAFDDPFVAVLDGQARPLDVRFTTLDVEHAGAQRAVVLASGHAAAAGRTVLAIEVRFTVRAGVAAIGVDVGLHNPAAAEHGGGFWELGDPGSVLVRSAAIQCATPAPIARAGLATDPGQPCDPVALPCRLIQHGSGGDHWQSRVHVNRDGVVAVDEPGYTVDEGGGGRTAGRRARPWLCLEHAGGALHLTSARFWEVFPKAFEVDAAGRLRIWSLPAATHAHEIQGGERCHFHCWLVVAAAADRPSLAWCQSPSTILPDISAVAIAEGLPALRPAVEGADTRYDLLVAAAMDGPDSFAAKREAIDEYGWRHFGDLYADHENGDTPGRQLVSHYNNQYDAILGLTLQALRFGDHRWWAQAQDLAWHVARIDVYWTDRDRAAYNGGAFWHTGHYVDAGKSTHRCYPRDSGLDGGGPSNEHCYAHGLLLHHRLTGDPISRQAVLRLGAWILAMDDGRLARWPLPWLSRAATGGASATVSPGYHGPGRGAANTMLALDHAFRLSGDARFPAKADEILRRVIHPEDDVAARQLLDVERRWSYTVFLQALGRYLWVHDPATAAARWDYARASLLHYARWMAEHEGCYLDTPEVLEFPTETWAAQDVRKSEVFDLAAYHAASADERRRFLERARYFHDRSLATLAASPTRTRTRPLVLLLSYGYARPWFERTTAGAPLRPGPDGPWPPRVTFVPQKAQAVTRLKWVAAAGVGVVLAGAAAVIGLWLG